MSEELRSYTPGWREQIAAWMAQNLTGDTREGYRAASDYTKAAEVAALPTPAGWAGPAYEVARGLGEAVKSYMSSKSGPSDTTKVDIPTVEKRVGEIEARLQDLDKQKLANGMNKKLSKERTTEINGQIEEERKALAAERQKAVADISNTRTVMEWEQSPLRERYPGMALAATVGSVPAAFLAARGVGNKVTKGVEGAVEAARAARSAGNPAEFVEAAGAAKSMANWAPAKMAAGTGAAALIPAEVQMLPDLIDYKTMPKDSRAYQEAEGQFSNIPSYLASAGIPMIGGTMGAMTGLAKSSAFSSAGRANAYAMSQGLSGNYADDVASAGKQISSQHKVDLARQQSDRTLRDANREQALRNAATEAAVRKLDDPATMTPEMAREMLARQISQQAVPAQLPQLQPVVGPSRRVPYSLNASEQDEVRRALSEMIMRGQQ